MAEAHLLVDQIEGDWAVLTEDAEEGQDYPVLLTALPAGTKEGDWLKTGVPFPYTVSSFFAAVEEGREQMPDFVLDEGIREATKSRVQLLMDELSG